MIVAETRADLRDARDKLPGTTAVVMTTVRTSIQRVSRIMTVACRVAAALNSLIVACSSRVAVLPDHSPSGIELSTMIDPPLNSAASEDNGPWQPNYD